MLITDVRLIFPKFPLKYLIRFMKGSKLILHSVKRGNGLAGACQDRVGLGIRGGAWRRMSATTIKHSKRK